MLSQISSDPQLWIVQKMRSSRPVSPVIASREKSGAVKWVLRRATSDLSWCAGRYNIQQGRARIVFSLLLVSPNHSLHAPCLSNKTNGFGAESPGHCQSKDRWCSRLDGHLLGICYQGFGVCFFFYIGGINLYLLTVISWGALFFIDTSVLFSNVIILHCIVCHSEMMKLGFWCRGIPPKLEIKVKIT